MPRKTEIADFPQLQFYPFYFTWSGIILHFSPFRIEETFIDDNVVRVSYKNILYVTLWPDMSIINYNCILIEKNACCRYILILIFDEYFTDHYELASQI